MASPSVLKLTQYDAEYANNEDKSDCSDNDHDDNTSSCNDSNTGGSTGTGRSGSSTLSKQQQEQIAQQESRNVFQLRMIVFAILILAGILVSFLIYRVTSNAEQAEFESQFEAVGDKIETAFQQIVSQRIGDIGALAVSMIAQGIDDKKHQDMNFTTTTSSSSKTRWPFVTMASFQERARKAMMSSGVLYTAIAPLVTQDDQVEWEYYVVGENSDWIDQGIRYQEEYGLNDILPEPLERPFIYKDGWEPPSHRGKFPIFYLDERNGEAVDTSEGPFLPTWQTSPVLKRSWVNRNLLRDVRMREDARSALTLGGVVVGGFDYGKPGGVDSDDYYTAFYASIMSVAARQTVQYRGDPMSNIYIPIFNSFNATTVTSRETVAVLVATVNWAAYFRNILPDGFNGIDVVLDNSCDGTYTFNIHGKDVILVGQGDHHERVAQYENMAIFSGFQDGTRIEDGTMAGLFLNQKGCNFTATIYPTKEFEETFTSNMPAMTTVAVSLIFLFTIFMFICYDRLVEHRQKLVLTKALKSSAIVSSLFPKHVQDKLMQDEEQGKGKKAYIHDDNRIKSFMKDGKIDQTAMVQSNKAIADLYPDATVFFADIAGFTAWSSTREPEQVFILLQTLYQEFDRIAQRRKVFKVETIGDCYMAVTGLPDPQVDHAVRMAKFASDCLINMNKLVRELETTLGPDTGDLGIRVGMHSGQVTAGVLRGDRARFQLFGDTVNTASRMESTSKKNQIQLSQTTADLLIAAGKNHWLKPRDDAIQAKGKGVMKTYWLTKVAPKVGSVQSGQQSSDMAPEEDHAALLESVKNIPMDEKKGRNVDWVCEILMEKIKLVVACREPSNKTLKKSMSEKRLIYNAPAKQTPFDEVVESIDIPKCKRAEAMDHNDLRHIQIDPIVKQQLHEYVSTVASTYHSNPFHNFDHACHVTMSVNKLLSRICVPGDDAEDDDIHAYIHSLKSDPITILAIVFSGVIHDADHSGCSNVQLMKEKVDMATHYKNKSIAEQNSLDLAWNFLMADQFRDLRNCMFATDAELRRFRQVVVNIVLATDIFDTELVNLRKRRWESAFSQEGNRNENIHNLRATIVMEHIIQASDIAHTMQHWHVYRKWNEKLFTELHLAYKAGRMGADPALFWYKGEIGFFDNYVIPLAKKLKECQVFGVSSDEYLSYAQANRSEWVERGEEIVAQMVQKLNSQGEDRVE